MAKKAVCIGINDYPGFDMDLAGCVNDAKAWADTLGSNGYDCVTLLNDQATRKQMLGALSLLLKTAGPEDTIAFTYSGHGTWIPDANGDEPDGKDEALCPYDMGKDGRNLIVDDELQKLIKTRPVGVRVLLITDSCHSGTVFRNIDVVRNDVRAMKRFIPPQAIFTGKKLEQVQRLALTPAKTQPSNDPLPGVVHFAGCQDVEYSYDTMFKGKPSGAFTGVAMQILKKLKKKPTTYKEFFDLIRKKLPSAEYPQTPQLNADSVSSSLLIFS